MFTKESLRGLSARFRLTRQAAVRRSFVCHPRCTLCIVLDIHQCHEQSPCGVSKHQPNSRLLSLVPSRQRSAAEKSRRSLEIVCGVVVADVQSSSA